MSVPCSHTLVGGLIAASVTPPPVGVTWSVCAVGWHVPDCESPGPATVGENRAWAIAEAPGGSTMRRVLPAPPARTCVGRAAPVEPRRVPEGIPRRVQGVEDVFFSLSAYTIWPAPALPGTRAKVPASCAPVQGLADDPGPGFVTVFVVATVCVCVTVTVFVPARPQPAAVSASAAKTSPVPARRPATLAPR